MQKSIPWITLLLLTAMVSWAHAAGLEMAVGGWQQNPSGTLSYQASSIDDVLNIEDDLNFDTENRVLGRLKIDMPAFLPNIYLMAAPMEFEGTGRKSVNFTFGDQTFGANTDLYSKVKLNQYDISLYYGIPALHTATAGVLNIDLGLNARIVDLSAEVSGQTSGVDVSEKESLTVVLPMAYLAVQIMPTDNFAIEAEVRGISISDNSLWSFIGRLRLNIAGPAFVAGGYRLDTLDIDTEDVVVDADFGGPFVEVGLKF